MRKGIDRSHKKVKVEETPKPVEKIVEKVERYTTSKPKNKVSRKKRSTK